MRCCSVQRKRKWRARQKEVTTLGQISTAFKHDLSLNNHGIAITSVRPRCLRMGNVVVHMAALRPAWCGSWWCGRGHNGTLHLHPRHETRLNSHTLGTHTHTYTKLQRNEWMALAKCYITWVKNSPFSSLNKLKTLTRPFKSNTLSWQSFWSVGHDTGRLGNPHTFTWFLSFVYVKWEDLLTGWPPSARSPGHTVSYPEAPFSDDCYINVHE